MFLVSMQADGGVGIIEDGVVYLFDRAGHFLREVGLEPCYVDGAGRLPGISVLSSRDSVEIGVVTDGSFSVYTSSLSLMSIVGKLNMRHNFVRMLTRSGKQNEVSYNQMIFIYPEGTNILDILEGIR